MQIQLGLELLRVVEQAAIASARTMGTGDRHRADQAATEAMRQVMDHVPMDGTVVIGEGERDEAPTLFIGEKVGAAAHNQSYQIRRWISPSYRSRAPISAPPVHPTPSPSWPPAKKAAFCMRLICTWKKSWSAPMARAPSTWMRP